MYENWTEEAKKTREGMEEGILDQLKILNAIADHSKIKIIVITPHNYNEESLVNLVYTADKDMIFHFEPLSVGFSDQQLLILGRIRDVAKKLGATYFTNVISMLEYMESE